MSQLATAPLLNPTIEVDNPNQKMLVKKSVNIVDFSLDNIFDSVRESSVNIDIMDWQKLAAKNKIVGSYQWNVDQVTRFVNLPIDYKFLRRLMTLGEKVHTFTSFSRLLISVKTTNNSLFQGLAVITNKNIPSRQFLENTYNVFTPAPHNIWQFQKIFIQPNDSNEINFFLPLNFPFTKIPNNLNSTTLTNYRSAKGEYLNDYVSSFLDIDIVVPLTTTSNLTSLTYTVSAQILDLQLAGISIPPSTT